MPKTSKSKPFCDVGVVAYECGMDWDRRGNFHGQVKILINSRALGKQGRRSTYESAPYGAYMRGPTFRKVNS